MKKIFLFSIFTFLFCSTTSALAVSTLPARTVWVTPENAKAGENVSINAFIYNDTMDLVVFAVVFKNGNKVIRTLSDIEVAPQTAIVVSTTYNVPVDPQTISVVIESALTKDNKKLSNLEGALGVTTLGLPAVTISKKVEVKGFFGSIINQLEDFRLEQLTNFSQLYGESSEKIENKKFEGLKNSITHLKDGNNDPEKFTFGQYVKYLYAQVGKTFFAHKEFYYTAIILAILAVLRFIFARFF